MDPTLLALAALIIGLAGGFAVGWTIANRAIGEWRERHAERDGACRDLTEKLQRVVPELATMSERAARADALALDLDAVRNDRETLRARVATLEADAANFAEREKLLREAREELLKEFQNAGAKVLGDAQKSFLERATERFDHAEKANEARIKAILEPVGAKLTSYEEQVRKLEQERVDAFGNLAGLIEGMRVGQEQIRAEAARLGNSLRNAPKARGRWGEQQLRNVLEQCGLAEHTDFVTEHSVNTDEGRLRPDAIVKIPGNKLLIIDAKASLNDYQDAFEAPDDATRDACLDRHLVSMRNHVQSLAAKSYQDQFDETPDYVVMFVPGDHFIAAALEHEAKRRAQGHSSDLWTYAFERRVLIASPTNLVAIARTIAQVWRQDGLAKEAREIGKLASGLYDSLAKTQEDLAKTGTYLGKAVKSFNDFSKTFDGNVLSRARRLKEKHIQAGKRELGEEIPFVEITPDHADADLLLEPPEATLIEAAEAGAAQDG